MSHNKKKNVNVVFKQGDKKENKKENLSDSYLYIYNMFLVKLETFIT